MKRSAFTLLELMVVVIIVGILAMIAMPQFFKAAEKARAAEGVNVLGALRGAQFRYYAESSTQSFTADLTDLDVGFDVTNFKFFTNLVPEAPTGSSDANLGCVERKTPLDYKLCITVQGRLTCSGGDCPGGFEK